MNFHITTPVSRPFNVEALIAMLRAAAPAGNLTWHPVFHRVYDQECINLKKHEWVFPLRTAIPEKWDACYWKCNWSLHNMQIVDGDYYGFQCDDDAYDPGYFDAMSELPKADVLLSSMRTYKNGELAGELTACRENIRVSQVGLSQFLVRGDVIRHYRFNNIWCGDGDLLERLDKAGHSFALAPTVYANWNKLPKEP